MSLIVRRTGDYKAFRISPGDTNYMICIADPVADGTAGIGFTAIVEVYAVGGKTPPNSHAVAHEMFYVLAGEGVAYCDGETVALAAGDSIVVPPGAEHVVENTGAGKLYTLTVMIPNEAFAELIHGGTPVPLDTEDLAVMRRVAMPS
ncbi:MAG: cupin domain-containing protein [Alphaproteobacteria bacterium]